MIQMFHVYKTYPVNFKALIDINLKVDKSEFIFVTGPSGAGKSTLLQLLFCAEKVTEGQILVNGRNIARLRKSSIPYLRRNIGIVFQDFKLLPQKTVFENVSFALKILGFPRKKMKRKVWQTLRLVGLEHKLDVLPRSLSGGEQQRVAIARALINDPAILLADEPTGNLDAEITWEMMQIFKNINARGTTVIIATHDKNIVERMQRRTIVLERGMIVATVH